MGNLLTYYLQNLLGYDMNIAENLHRWIMVFVMSPLWFFFVGKLSIFAVSGPVIGMTFLWFMDFFTGCWKAIKLGTFEKKKMAQCLPNYFIYLMFLAVAASFVASSSSLALISGAIEAVIIMIVGVSVLANLGEISDKPLLKKLGKILSNNIESHIESRLRVIEKSSAIRQVAINELQDKTEMLEKKVEENPPVIILQEIPVDSINFTKSN